MINYRPVRNVRNSVENHEKASSTIDNCCNLYGFQHRPILGFLEAIQKLFEEPGDGEGSKNKQCPGGQGQQIETKNRVQNSTHIQKVRL